MLLVLGVKQFDNTLMYIVAAKRCYTKPKPKPLLVKGPRSCEGTELGQLT